MLKWIEIIASFFIGKMQSNDGPSLRESAIAIFEEITFKSRKAVSLIVVSLAAAIFALGGFFISLLNATTQYDQTGSIAFTSTFASGLVLVLIAMVTLAWVFGSAWPGVKKFKTAHESRHREQAREQHEETHQRQPSSLEYALSMLVMDFVKEREMRRNETMSAMQTEPDFRAQSMARGEDLKPMTYPQQAAHQNIQNSDPIH